MIAKPYKPVSFIRSEVNGTILESTDSLGKAFLHVNASRFGAQRQAISKAKLCTNLLLKQSYQITVDMSETVTNLNVGIKIFISNFFPQNVVFY